MSETNPAGTSRRGRRGAAEAPAGDVVESATEAAAAAGNPSDAEMPPVSQSEAGARAARPATSRRRSAPGGTAAPAAQAGDPPLVHEDGSSIDADAVQLRMSAVGRVDSSELGVTMGAVGAARSDQLTVERGAIGAAMANTVDVRQGYARSIFARQVQLDRAAARLVVAADVQATRTAVVFLVARRVGGDVRVLFDWRGALAFGAVAGILAGLIGRARRRER